MTTAAIRKEIERLTPDEQDEIAVALAVLRRQRDSVYRQELARRIDDRTPQHWLTGAEARRRLESE